MTSENLDRPAINTIRTLSIDAVQQANPDIRVRRWRWRTGLYDLERSWVRSQGSDLARSRRFVLSNGHASMLLWSILHRPRCRRSTPNMRSRHAVRYAGRHPPLPATRQQGTGTSGISSGVRGRNDHRAVGPGHRHQRRHGHRAKFLGARYNRPGFEIFDFNIYAVCGDGCMMEGVGSEAASLAGHLGLDDLCWVYDNNHITIEGNTRITFTEDVAARFMGYQWNVLRVGDANDIQRIEDALTVFRATKGRPTLIILDSHIGYGSPHKVDTAEIHGDPLGPEEVKLTKRAYGWPEDAKFLVPDGVYDHFNDGIGRRGADARERWETLFTEYRRKFPDLATEIDQMQRRELPAEWDRNLPNFPADPKGIAGRDASGQVLNVLARNIPWFMGGSADVGPSNRTTLKFEGAGDFEPETPTGRNFHFGIREHAMAAIVNGMSLSKLRAFGATYFIFSDYARPAMRLSALMELPTIMVFSHDAMGDGEDGPTHQPVEQLISLRAVPGLMLLRPADANEVVEAYRVVMRLRHQPAVIVVSRQPLPTFDRERYASAAGLARGAYVMADPPDGKPEIILIATGSEVALVVGAHEELAKLGVRSRVVSMPSWDLFEHQPQSYRDSVLPPNLTARIAVEQGSALGWDRYVGAAGRVIGMKAFGASAPLKELLRHFGFEPERVVEVAMKLLGRD